MNEEEQERNEVGAEAADLSSAAEEKSVTPETAEERRIRIETEVIREDWRERGQAGD